MSMSQERRHPTASRTAPTTQAALRRADPRDVIADPALRPRAAAADRLATPTGLRWVRARDLAAHGALLLATRMLSADQLARHRAATSARAGAERVRDLVAQRRLRLAPPDAFGRSGRTGTDRQPIGR